MDTNHCPILLHVIRYCRSNKVRAIMQNSLDLNVNYSSVA